MSKIDDLKSALDDPEKRDKLINSAIDDANSFTAKRKKMLNLVLSKEYLDWILSTVENSEHHSISDDMYDYNHSVDAKDKEYAEAIYYLQMAIEDFAEKQGVPSITPENEYFPEYGNVFYYGAHYFEIVTCSGQGSFTTISYCSKKPKKYVVLEDKEAEFVQYIIVNEDLNMSKGKIAAQVGHACTMCAVNEIDNPFFKKWYNSAQKKIVLRAHQKDMEKLKDSGYYVVIDNGLTEIAPGSLTAISLGVVVKEDVQSIVKRLQLLKD